MADEQGTGTPATALAAVPLRGTQSFVGVMVQVWKRPWLTGMELLWRWLAGAPLLWLTWWAGTRALTGVAFNTAGLESMTVFKPVDAAATVSQQVAAVLPALLPLARWLLPLALGVWSAMSALGRTASLRRLDPTLRPRFPVLAALGLLRTVALLATLGVWCWGTVLAGRYAVTSPADAGVEPNVVLFAALVVGLTLLLFMAWSLTVWVLDAAPLFAMAGDLGLAASVRAAVGSAALRSKLVELNLVMGIVKVALLVLTLVFSASPLPFVTVETQAYLNFWWVLVAIFYLVGSDLFHVVRRAAYLSLFRALVTPIA